MKWVSSKSLGVFLFCLVLIVVGASFFVGLGEPLDAFVLEAWMSAVFLWNYEFTFVDGHALTFGKLVIGGIFFAVGLSLSRALSKILRRRVFNRVIANEQGRSAFQTISHYVLVMVFSLMALKLAGIPLTIFTLLGGAIAIGLGFGSQNLINNFISGLILLAEKPINVGDMIEVDGMYGKIIRVGARCTNVRTFTNVDILVPNSSLLEKNVVNWTLSDNRVRTQVNVGVAYGSPVEDVIRLIHEAATAHESIAEDPKPIVLFEEFGDNALHFEVHFWIRVRVLMDRKIVESDVRRKIDDLFRKNNICIAFPQRDVHLDSIRPLEVVVKNSA